MTPEIALAIIATTLAVGAGGVFYVAVQMARTLTDASRRAEMPAHIAFDASLTETTDLDEVLPVGPRLFGNGDETCCG